MKKKDQSSKQPETFTPGITKGMVRQHAFRLYRDKLERDALTEEKRPARAPPAEFRPWREL